MTEEFQSDYKLRGIRWGGVSFNVPKFFEGEFVLETGCGNGKTLKSLPADAVGIDISTEAVSLAGGNALAGDICFLPFGDCTFDAVLCFHVLGHLKADDRRKAAAEMFRVLKKGGKIYFKGFSKRDFRFGKGDEVEPDSFLKGDGITTHFFDETEVRDLFGEGDVSLKSWTLMIRAVPYLREEVCGVFEK
ncbi:MAG: class I SAM-dependent methyltransferase [Methanocorpusculum sp.]|nr:class I SAM-dependent methyltransferase [Methanocorpusculum sp.]